MKPNKIIELTDENFHEKVINAKSIILVDFWAEWCGPCKMMTPILQEVAEEYADKLTIAKLNVDNCPKVAPKYDLRGIPTLLIFKNGKVVGTKIGFVTKKQLIKFINANLT
ncbi:thioredoxin TrxA [Candidatus Ishikawella capsulata]|nr:thioredoxin TrxA [Candidatus Ishikawaella capsulata]